MMGVNREQKELFSYRVDLDRRVRSDNPLGKIKEEVDFSWIRGEVEHLYGYNGNESVDPVMIVKLLLLLYWDNVRSERELMKIVCERLDYLWFLGLGLDDEVPNHSVLSKARARWGREVFEKLFVETVRRSVRAELVWGERVHVDGSLIEADASAQSVVEGPAELMEELKLAYAAQERKLTGNLGDRYYKPVNERLMSTTDPDAPNVRRTKGGHQGESRARYKNHRVVDDENGVITAMQTTGGDVEENRPLEELLEQHEGQKRGQELIFAISFS